MTFEEFKRSVEARELRALDHGRGHWQIVGGPKIVNWYPFSARGPILYVNGTKAGVTEPKLENVIAAVFS